MGNITLNVNPTSYKFTSSEEATSIQIETNASSVQFIRVNEYGTGSAVFDSKENILTAKSYGSGRYKFVAKEGSEEAVVYFDLEVARPLLGKQTDYKLNLDSSSTNQLWAYTPPDGYRLKLIDYKELKAPITEVSYQDNTVMFNPASVGTAKYDIVVEKIDPVENEVGLEYITGTLSLDIFSMLLVPDNQYLYTKIGKTVVVDTVKCILGSTGKGAQLTFETTTSELDILELKATEVEDPEEGFSYNLEIKAKLPGEGKIEIKYNNEKIYELSIEIVDIKELSFTPEIKNVTLPYNSIHNITDIKFNNNDVLDEIEVINSTDTIVKTDLTKLDEETNVYSLSIQNITSVGGSATVTIKSINTIEGQAVINVKCYKEVKEGEVTSYPSVSLITINEQNSFEIEWLSVTNSDRLEVISTDTSIAEVRLMDIDGIPTDPGTGDPIEFPIGSIQKKLYVIGKLRGECDIAIKGIVNDNDTTVTKIIKVKVLPNDELPDYSKLVNLQTDNLSRSRQGDVIINLPDESSVLVLREKIQQNLVVEFGYSFDYVEDTNPTKNINPTTFSDTTENAIWLNRKTNEVFTCIDSTTDDNKWKGSNGTTINYIEYPNPGEKGFGVGPAPEGLAEKYDLSPLPGTFDRNSDQYGNYIDKSNSVFVFIPKHYIIPKFDNNLVKSFPYDGMSYEFSWVPVEGKFEEIHIPRCFINKGKVQDGIFIAKYNNTTFQEYYKEDSYTVANTNKKVATSGIHSTYSVMMSGSSKVKKWHPTLTDSKMFPELYVMAKALIPDGVNKNDLGRHNMSIFIQTMLINLGDLHTIASYEKSVREDVCYKLKHLVSGTWVRELTNLNAAGAEIQKYNPVKRIQTGDSIINNEVIHFSSESGSIKYDYQRLFSHNGQYCGVYDVGGPVNTPLPGILVVQDDMTAPNNYKVYALKKDVDIAEIEKKTFDTVKDTNTTSLVYRSALFDLNNYDLLIEIVNNEEVSKLLYMDNHNAYTTHLSNESLLGGTTEQYYSINAGLNLGSLTTFTSGNYTEQYTPVVDRAKRVSKFKNSVYNMGFLSKKEEMRTANSKWYGMFTANYVPNLEEATVGSFNMENVYNGYRTRVLRHIGALHYFKRNNSEYMFGSRTCITPEDSHINSDLVVG